MSRSTFSKANLGKGFGLGEGGDFHHKLFYEVHTSNLRNTVIQSTKPLLLPNRCYVFALPDSYVNLVATVYSPFCILHSLTVSVTETKVITQAMIKFGCIGGTTPSGHVPVPGISNAGKNIPQKHKELKPINNMENRLPLSL
jgi:hypothetical protein